MNVDVGTAIVCPPVVVVEVFSVVCFAADNVAVFAVSSVAVEGLGGSVVTIIFSFGPPATSSTQNEKT